MPYLKGIETLAIGRRKTVEISYENRQWVDMRGRPLAVQDAVCYDCRNNTFVLEEDPIDYCPHCGYRGGKGWADFDEARKWSWDQDFRWLHRLGRNLFAARRSDGAWMLMVAKSADEILAQGRYVDARALSLEGPQ